MTMTAYAPDEYQRKMAMETDGDARPEFGMSMKMQSTPGASVSATERRAPSFTIGNERR